MIKEINDLSAYEKHLTEKTVKEAGKLILKFFQEKETQFKEAGLTFQVIFPIIVSAHCNTAISMIGIASDMVKFYGDHKAEDVFDAVIKTLEKVKLEGPIPPGPDEHPKEN